MLLHTGRTPKSFHNTDGKKVQQDKKMLIQGSNSAEFSVEPPAFRVDAQTMKEGIGATCACDWANQQPQRLSQTEAAVASAYPEMQRTIRDGAQFTTGFASTPEVSKLTPPLAADSVPRPLTRRCEFS